MIRKIIYIDEDKCNGCGLCVPSCAEGALQIIDGKARLVKDEYCDGLGACLGECPMDALHIIEREAEEFDEAAAMAYVAKIQREKAAGCQCSNHDAKHTHEHGAHHTHDCNHTQHEQHDRHGGGCPGSKMRVLKQNNAAPEETGAGDISFSLKSQLQQWPVQLTLVPVQAPYFIGADLLITADCVPFAYPDYHPKLLKGKKVVVGCPKLDDSDSYIEKLSSIIKLNDLNSITVAFMEVPCCSGMVYAAEQAVKAAGVDIPVYKVRISLEGKKENL